MKFCRLTILLLSLQVILYSQEDLLENGFRLFPSERIFPTLFLDPLEVLMSGGAYIVTSDNGELQGMESFVSLGINRPAISWHSDKYAFQLSIEAGSFNHFEVKMAEGQDKLIGGLLNIDYRVGGSLAMGNEKRVMRIRFFHVSSHLGDDYIIRNDLYIPNDRSNNYEQVDISILQNVGNNYFYMGAGEIISKYAYRERFSLWTGGYLTQGSKSKSINLFEAIHIRLIQEYNFNPDIRLTAGLNFNNNEKTGFRLWLELFSGYLPYGTLFKEKISWIGLGGAIIL